MYGRKIMQILEVPEADSESEDDAPPQPVALRPRPPALGALDRWSSWDIPSLTLPKAKRQGAGLRIATNPDFSSSQELVGTASLRLPPSARRQAYNPRTPDSSFTFGRAPSFQINTPPPSSISHPISPLSPSYSASHTQHRRAERYSRDEAQLVSSLQTHSLRPSASPQELQVLALAKATSFLTERAEESKHKVTVLRARLAAAGSDVDEDQYRTWQKERWMEEHWINVVEGQTDSLKQSAKGIFAFQQQTSSQNTPQIEPDTGKEESEKSDIERRKEANLAKFFSVSATHTSILSHQPSRHARSSSLASPRILSPLDIEPLKLRTWPLVPETLKKPIEGFSGRPLSVDDSRLVRQRAQAKSPPPLLKLVDENEPNDTADPEEPTKRDWPRSAPATATDSVFPNTSSGSTSYYESSNRASSSSSTRNDSNQPPRKRGHGHSSSLASLANYAPKHSSTTSTDSGYATIYSSPVSRTKEEILEAFAATRYPVPEYVSSLLDTFEEVTEKYNALAPSSPVVAKVPRGSSMEASKPSKNSSQSRPVNDTKEKSKSKSKDKKAASSSKDKDRNVYSSPKVSRSSLDSTQSRSSRHHASASSSTVNLPSTSATQSKSKSKTSSSSSTSKAKSQYPSMSHSDSHSRSSSRLSFTPESSSSTQHRSRTTSHPQTSRTSPSTSESRTRYHSHSSSSRPSTSPSPRAPSSSSSKPAFRMSFGGLHIGGHLGGKKATSLSNAVATFGQVAEGLSAIREGSWDEITPSDVPQSSSRDHESTDHGRHHHRHHHHHHHDHTRDDPEQNASSTPKKPQTKRASSSGLFHRKKHADDEHPNNDDTPSSRDGARTPVNDDWHDTEPKERPAIPRRQSLLRKVRPPSFRRSSTDDTVTPQSNGAEGSQSTSSRPQTRTGSSLGFVPRISEEREPVEDSFANNHTHSNGHKHSHSHEARAASPGSQFLRPEAVTSMNFNNANGSVTHSRSASPSSFSLLSPAGSVSLPSGTSHDHGLAALGASTASPNVSMVDLLKRRISDFGGKGKVVA